MTTRTRDAFWPVLAVIAALALAVRALNVLVWRPTDPGCATVDGCFRIAGDAAYGHLQGELMAKGEWFASSAAYLSFEEIRPGAGDPPLYALLLGWVSALHGTGGWAARLIALVVLAAAVAACWGVARRVGGSRAGLVALVVAGAAAVGLVVLSVGPGSAGTAHRLVSSLAGVGGIVLLGVLGRRIVGPRTGLVAAGLGALYPMLWINDGMLLSEALYVPMVLLAVLAGYHFWDRPSAGSAALVGAAIAGAALTRAEAGLLFAFLLVPLVLGMRELDAGARVRFLGVSWVVGAALMAPWLGYNLARFEEPALMTSGTGAVLSAGSCDTAYRGEFVGYYGANCFQEYVEAGWTEWPDPGLDESAHDLPAREGAVRYIRENLDQLPVVMVFRVGRMWDVYKPGQNTELNYQVEGRGRWASWAGLLFYYALVPPAAAGAVWLWRRRLPLSPLLSVLAMVTATAALTFGVTRYRAPADAVLVLLAAAAVEAGLRRVGLAPSEATTVLPRGERLVASSAPREEEPARG